MNRSDSSLATVRDPPSDATSLDWCAERLAQLGLADAMDFITDCVYALSSEDDVRACLCSLLPEQCPALVDALVERWRAVRAASANNCTRTTATAEPTTPLVAAQAAPVVDRGKLCECGGLEHSPWNNCLCCGRISCTREQPFVEPTGVCPFCETAFHADQAQIARRAQLISMITPEHERVTIEPKRQVSSNPPDEFAIPITNKRYH